MARSAESLLDEARKLPAEERAMLAERLLETLDPEADSDVESAWAAKAAARAEEAERDPAVLVDWAEAKAEIERDFKKRRRSRRGCTGGP